jgi:hypothetical protein
MSRIIALLPAVTALVNVVLADEIAAVTAGGNQVADLPASSALRIISLDCGRGLRAAASTTGARARPLRTEL